MRLICLFIAMISGSFAVAATVSTESDGLVVTLKNDTNGHPVDSIKDGSKRDYKYLVDIINKRIEHNTLNCAKAIVKCDRIGFQPTGVAIVKLNEAFPDIKGKNKDENRKIIAIKGQTLKGKEQFFWAVLPQSDTEFKKSASQCDGMFTTGCAFALNDTLRTDGHFRYGKLNPAVFSQANASASSGGESEDKQTEDAR